MQPPTPVSPSQKITRPVRLLAALAAAGLGLWSLFGEGWAVDKETARGNWFGALYIAWTGTDSKKLWKDGVVEMCDYSQLQRTNETEARTHELYMYYPFDFDGIDPSSICTGSHSMKRATAWILCFSIASIVMAVGVNMYIFITGPFIPGKSGEKTRMKMGVALSVLVVVTLALSTAGWVFTWKFTMELEPGITTGCGWGFYAMIIACILFLIPIACFWRDNFELVGFVDLENKYEWKESSEHKTLNRIEGARHMQQTHMGGLQKPADLVMQRQSVQQQGPYVILPEPGRRY
eukprot:GHVN01058737.1.p1 GENE.GHVN01058737.1~~GHVN01058737.1.p1  ORF type:complete len:292 (+),score=26.08 GHVN01058737.1:97-972(+)